jgi:hypothetical protein
VLTFEKVRCSLMQPTYRIGARQVARNALFLLVIVGQLRRKRVGEIMDAFHNHWVSALVNIDLPVLFLNLVNDHVEHLLSVYVEYGLKNRPRPVQFLASLKAFANLLVFPPMDFLTVGVAVIILLS